MPRGIVILAAGASTRLGRPKQLVPFEGRTLLERVTWMARSSQAEVVAVVLGAHAEKCRRLLDSFPVRVIENPDWSEGIASSIRCGVRAMANEMDGAVILPCDQPRVTGALLDELMNAATPIAACEYAGGLGAPAYFSRQFFGELESLEGDTGAREILARHPALVTAISFPEGAFDVDTPADVQRLKHADAPAASERQPF